LHSGDVIKGIVEPYGSHPSGQIIVGPFNNNIWNVKMKEAIGYDGTTTVVMEAAYDFDIVEETVDITAALYKSYTDASPTWETVATTNLVGHGKTSFIVDWTDASLGLSKTVPPTVVKFRITAGSEVHIEVEEGIL